jgi:hypothetical protein
LVATSMLNLLDIQRAVDLQQRSYRLLRWLGTAIDAGQVGLDQLHDTLSLAQAARAFLDANLTALPPEHRPAPEELQAFANMFASYLTTSFDLLPNPGTRGLSPCGCTCELCIYLVSAPHLAPKKLAPVDKVRARGLEIRCIEAVARERGVVLGAGAAEALADLDSLREPLAMATYGRELLKRMVGDFEGPEVLALWRRFAWTVKGSPKKGFTFTMQSILDAETAVVRAIEAL